MVSVGLGAVISFPFKSNEPGIDFLAKRKCPAPIIQ
jgi:hypothetical protein